MQTAIRLSRSIFVPIHTMHQSQFNLWSAALLRYLPARYPNLESPESTLGTTAEFLFTTLAFRLQRAFRRQALSFILHSLSPRAIIGLVASFI